jgi:hypothetical protein
MALGSRVPGAVAAKGPTRVPTPGERPSFILGSRPVNLRAPLPGARIKPMTGQRDYGKTLTAPLSGPGVGTAEVQ